MKRYVVRTALIALTAFGSSYGQSVSMRAQIPFGFEAGGATLPAGTYSVDMSEAGVVVIESAAQKTAAVIFTTPVQSVGLQPASKLVFLRYGDAYLLSQIWMQGDSSGREATTGTRERELIAIQRGKDKTVPLSTD